MIDFFDDEPITLSDSEVAAGARPGEDWEQARNRLMGERHKARYEAYYQSSLSESENKRLFDLTQTIRDACLDALSSHRGYGANALLAQVLNVFEYCLAIYEGRMVELIHRDGSPEILLDELYMLLSRLNQREAKDVLDSFIGLLDILGNPEPYDTLSSLEEDGLLSMVLRG